MGSSVREITYSEGVVIDDPALMATLTIFCEKIWLPDTTVADHVQAALRDANDPAGDPVKWDERRATVQEWEHVRRDLFSEGVVRRLPPNSPEDHTEHRPSQKTLEGPLYDRVCMRFHLIRGMVPPGTEFFDDGGAKAQADLAKSLFYLELPRIVAANPDQILSLRYEAQEAGLESFWGEIEEQTRLALGQEQNLVARAEKIRDDFAKWNRDRVWVRTGAITAGAMTTVALWAWGPDGLAAPMEALVSGALLGFVPPWVTEWHAQWIDYNKHRRKAFKCISRIDRKMRQVL